MANLNPEDQNVADENIADVSEELTSEEEIETDQSSSEEEEEEESDDTDETTEDADESDPDSDAGDEPAEKTEEELKQEKINHAFKKKSYQLQVATREKEEAIERADAAEKKLAELTAPKAPEIPELPDVYDPKYKEKMEIRDSAILAKAKFDKRAEEQKKEVDEANRQVYKAREEEVKTKQEGYVSQVETLGLDKKEMEEYEEAITPYITPRSAPTIEYILGDENGPLLVKFLAEDPVELEKVTSMNPMEAAVHLANVVTPRALKLKPKNTKTPKPLKVVEKKGSVKTESHYLKGATFE